jgi:hypothetical protein
MLKGKTFKKIVLMGVKIDVLTASPSPKKCASASRHIF